MGGSTSITSLSFDILFEPDPNVGTLKLIGINAINWLYTNRQGMVFGILLAATLMTLFAQFNAAAIRNRFANSAIGMLMGSSLGVCVNCAAPIAQGMFKSGARKETALSTMVSSPTLNFIVLAMVFSLFPFYLALIKVGLTILFITLLLPLVTWLFPDKRTAQSFEDGQVCSIQESPFSSLLPEAANSSWTNSIRWTAVTFARNLFYIIKVAVPLMLLAGLLGAVLITLVPLDELIGLLPSGSRPKIIMGMFGLALLCVFLPVPMAFDVIVSAVLLAAGLPIHYVAVVLFCLGIYSIYGYFIAAQIVSYRTASVLFVVLAGMGVGAGLIAGVTSSWVIERENRVILSELGGVTDSFKPARIDSIAPMAATPVVAEAAPQSLWSTVEPPTPWPTGISVKSVSLAPASTGAGNTLFEPMLGRSVGIDPPYSFEIDNALLMHFRSVSTGDIHGDGWTDLVVSDNKGLFLYANQQGKQFRRQALNLPRFTDTYVTNAVLVDLNNDRALDLFIATFENGNFIAFNDNGRFDESRLVTLPNHPSALRTASSAFGDIDRDGDMDIVLGNWSVGVVGNQLSLPSSQNVWLRQNNGSFIVAPLPGKPGETLSTLISDINGDSVPDLFIGNDFEVPDAFYLGSKTGQFSPITPQTSPGIRSTVTTMSIATSDVNNDLVPEIYLSQISEMPDAAPKVSRIGPDLCDQLPSGPDRDTCVEIQNVLTPVVGAINRTTLAECYERVPEQFRTDCVALLVLFTGTFTDTDPQRCAVMPSNWKYLNSLCEFHHKHQATTAYVRDDTDIPNSGRFNVFLERNANNKFEDTAAQRNLQLTGWAWNSKFADLDNDTWQDLFVTNGQMGLASAYTNIMMRNTGDGQFSYLESSGLNSLFDTGAYTYFDYDNDGDLDIAAVPQSGPILFYKNQANGNAIEFELDDQRANRYGIGSKIVIHYGPDQREHQLREIQASGGFISYDAPIAHFGLGKNERVDKVEVRWSTGEVSTLQGPFNASRRYLIQRAP